MSEVNSTNPHQFSYDPETDVCYRTLDFMGFPGYRVGDDGFVQSCWKKVSLGLGGGTRSIITDEWRRLKPGVLKSSHLVVDLYDRDGKSKMYQVHRLVLLAFVGPCPLGKLTRHFPNRDPADNRLSNLLWGTPKENQSDRVFHGTDNRGERHGFAKLTEVAVRAIRECAVKGECSTQIAVQFGISASNVRLIVTRKAWKHIV